MNRNAHAAVVTLAALTRCFRSHDPDRSLLDGPEPLELTQAGELVVDALAVQARAALEGQLAWSEDRPLAVLLVDALEGKRAEAICAAADLFERAAARIIDEAEQALRALLEGPQEA